MPNVWSVLYMFFLDILTKFSSVSNNHSFRITSTLVTPLTDVTVHNYCKYIAKYSVHFKTYFVHDLHRCCQSIRLAESVDFSVNKLPATIVRTTNRSSRCELTHHDQTFFNSICVSLFYSLFVKFCYIVSLNQQQQQMIRSCNSFCDYYD